MVFGFQFLDTGLSYCPNSTLCNADHITGVTSDHIFKISRGDGFVGGVWSLRPFLDSHSPPEDLETSSISTWRLPRDCCWGWTWWYSHGQAPPRHRSSAKISLKIYFGNFHLKSLHYLIWDDHFEHFGFNNQRPHRLLVLSNDFDEKYQPCHSSSFF